MSSLLISVEQINGWVGTALWPFFRVASLFAILPTLGGGEVPVKVRIGLSLVVTAIVLPFIGIVPAVDPLSIESLLITINQVLIGMAMGFAILVVFNAVTLAGESIAITMGLGFALMNDPQNGVQVPTVSQFYLVMATLLFLAFNGHHEIIKLLAESFMTIPIGKSLGPDAIWVLLRWAGTVFSGALSIAMPALAAMLSINIVMGVITRAAPQLNLFSVGFPITMIVGFLAILFTLPLLDKKLQILFLESNSVVRGMLGS